MHIIFESLLNICYDIFLYLRDFDSELICYPTNAFTIIHGINLEKLVIILVPFYNDKSTCFDMLAASSNANKARIIFCKLV